MELKQGYKQTELGIIPKEWEVKSIDQIFSFYSTSNYSKAQMTLEGDVGCLHYGLIHAIKNSCYNVKSGIKYYVDIQQAKYEFVVDGDIVMVDASEDLSGVNKSVEISGIGAKLYISGLHTFLLRDRGFLAEYFRGAILNSNIAKTQMLRLAVGMKVFGVSKHQIKTVLLPVPPITEQTAIANALSDMDSLISQTEKLIEKKKAIKQGAMQELLKPKEGWVTKKLGDVAKFFKGSGLPKADLTEDGRYRCIHYGELFTFYKENIDNIKSRTNKNFGAFLSSMNDVLMPTSDVTPNGLATASCINENNIVLGGDILVIRSDSNIIDGVFLSYSIKFNRQQIMKLVSGSTVYHLYGSDMSKYIFCFPEIKIQQEISRLLIDMEDEINKYQTKLTKLKQQKQGMMQALLTGKIRLIS